jgi:nicotinate-nucleotide pyrophosphorylase (carboxylating)
MKPGDAEFSNCVRLVSLALYEDLGRAGDRTSQTILPAEQKGSAVLVARGSGILAGLPVVDVVMDMVGMVLARGGPPHEAPFPFPMQPEGKVAFQVEPPTVTMEAFLEDGQSVTRGSRIARIEGLMRHILAAERSSLNFLQHLSGIATLTSRFVKAIDGLPCRIFDTRKTTPGWRLLEKYAVRCGGGFNHRIGLYDGVLIKDNHLAALGGGANAIRQSIQLAREKNGPEIPIEIEVENLNLLDVAFASRPDIVLLDNMSPDQLKKAVRRRNEKAPRIQLEASGGITLENVRAVAETGVDRISVGALTHSAPALDIALDYETV